MFVCKLDVDDVVAWFSGAICHFTCTIFHILTIDIHFTWTFDGQSKTSISFESRQRGNKFN